MAEAKQARFPIAANAGDHARHLRTANIQRCDEARGRPE